ncbi:hypothetical protein L208DRAFT_516752 [Tricholoma matsutake]|nr:hypothetical protein L208DRAFT_516752 [Tricholoma matsutake 945]
MSGYPEPLEYIFQQVERDTERRAQEELSRNELGEFSQLFQTESSSAKPKTKERRRGSITITRVGQLPDDRPKSSRDLFSKGRFSRFSTIAEESPLYQAHLAHDSTNTFSSRGDGPQDLEEDEHTTEVQITGTQKFPNAMQSFLPRRLTRSRSVNVVPSKDANMVIDVSIEKATVESEKSDQLSQASVHLGGSLRKQPSTLTMSASSLARKGWVTKAKGFTRRFRRTTTPSGSANPIPP